MNILWVVKIIFIFYLQLSDKLVQIDSKSTNKEIKITTASFKEKLNIIDRFPPPTGYKIIPEASTSYPAFIQSLPLMKAGTKIQDYKGNLINDQKYHVAVMDIDIETSGLIQCADILMKLRAEYLFQNNKSDQIKFHFTSGDLFLWSNYLKGFTPNVQNNHVSFSKNQPRKPTQSNLEKYMQYIYQYCGTVSLAKETNKITNPKSIRCGDMIITPGSPGHAAFICNRAINKKGDMVYLIAQGFTPSQSIHIITNLENPSISPWYKLKINQNTLNTPRYIFKKPIICSFDKN